MAHVRFASSEKWKVGKRLLCIRIHGCGHGQTNQGLIKVQAYATSSEIITLHGIDAIKNLMRNKLHLTANTGKYLE